MLIKLLPKTGLVSLFVAAAVYAPIGAAHADDLKAAQQRRARPEVTGAIDARAGTLAAPPANGVTELPLPMLVKSKAAAAATALDWLVEEASANVSAPANAVPAANPATPVKAAPPIHLSAPKSMSSLRMRHASRKALLA